MYLKASDPMKTEIGLRIPLRLIWCFLFINRLQYEGPAKVLSLESDYFSATFYQTYVYYKPSKYSPFTETHFCNLFISSRKADK